MLEFSGEVVERLRDTPLRAVVTGAGGWLGRATLELLDRAYGDDRHDRIVAYASSARDVTLTSGRRVSIRPLPELDEEGDAGALVFHYAYLGKEKVAEYGARAFAQTNRAINETVMRYCRSLRSGGVFFASSGAAHFVGGSDTDPDREPYGAAKVADEQHYLALARDGFSSIVCRIFNLGGPFINKLDAYALSCILLDIIHDRPITLRASLPVYRSFVHVGDVIEMATRALLDGTAPAQPFDTAGDEVVEVGELAERARMLLGRPGLAITRPAVDGTKEDRYVGDGAVFHRLVRESGMALRSLDRQILDTAEYLRISA